MSASQPVVQVSFTHLPKAAKKLVRQWKKENANIERPSWEHYLLALAMATSHRTHDAQTGTGCVLTSSSNEILATGYNGFSRGLDNDVLPNTRPDKYEWIHHAERNAIMSCARNGRATLGAIAYITLPPCYDCLSDLWDAGIHKVVHLGLKARMIDEKMQAKIDILRWLIGDRMEFIDVNPASSEFLSKKYAEYLGNE